MTVFDTLLAPVMPILQQIEATRKKHHNEQFLWIDFVRILVFYFTKRCGSRNALIVALSNADATGLLHQLYQGYHDILARLSAEQRLHIDPVVEAPDPDFLFIAPRLQLVFFPPDWFAAYNPHPSSGVQFVGGQARLGSTPAPSWLAELPDDRPLVVVAQSTIYGPPVSQLPLIFEAVGQIGGYALVGGSLDKRQACEPLPDYVRWEPWLDYAHVLPYAAAIVHHGGMGTTHAAICHAVPQVVTPAAADQFLHAERVMTHKIGVAIPPQHGRCAVIAAALKEVLEKAQYRHAARRLQAEFARYGGVARAAELLIQLAFMNSCT